MNWQRYERYNTNEIYRPILHTEITGIGTLIIGERWGFGERWEQAPFTDSNYKVYRERPLKSSLASYVFTLTTLDEDTITDSDPVAIMPVEALKKEAVAWVKGILQSALDSLGDVMSYTEENFKRPIQIAFGGNLWQCEYFADEETWQIVVEIERQKRVIPKALRQILAIGKTNARKSLRIAFKLKSGLTVATMRYDKQAVEDYSDSDDIEQTAQEYHIVSRLN